MADIKILLLCNNTIALPALRELLFFQQVSAVVIPSKNTALRADLDELMQGTDVPLITVDRKNFKKTVCREIEKNNVQAVFMMTFPYLVPKDLLLLPPRGFINFHYGKLPEYRGPEPIFTQVMMQEKNPALTVHIATEGIDDGPVIIQEQVGYDENDTYGLLQYKLAAAGAKLVTLLMKILSFGSILPAAPQDEGKAAYHKKPTAASLMIDWKTMDSKAIRALVNACNPWNKGCGAVIRNRVIGITEVEVAENNGREKVVPGTIITLDDENGLQVYCCDDHIIKITIFYTEEGFMSGKKLAKQGIAAGELFGTL
jgi:methionyl-tRNA formyltransferase